MAKKTYQEQMALLEAQGFSFVEKGKKCVYWVVVKYADSKIADDKQGTDGFNLVNSLVLF